MPTMLTADVGRDNSLQGMAGNPPPRYNSTVDFSRAIRERRTRRHLSQLDLALPAGTTQRHLSFIESGRSVPGRTMVVRLAESLELPLRERNELLLAAGYAPAYPERSLDDPVLAPVRTAIDHILRGCRPTRRRPRLAMLPGRGPPRRYVRPQGPCSRPLIRPSTARRTRKRSHVRHAETGPVPQPLAILVSRPRLNALVIQRCARSRRGSR